MTKKGVKLLFCILALAASFNALENKSNQCSNYDTKNPTYKTLSRQSNEKFLIVSQDDSHKNVAATLYLKGCNSEKRNEYLNDKCVMSQNEVGFIYGTDKEGNSFCESISRHNNQNQEENTNWNFYYIDDRFSLDWDKVKEEEDGDFNFNFEKNNGLKFTGSNKGFNEIGYNVDINILCNEGKEDDEFKAIGNYNKEKQVYSIVSKSLHGCSINLLEITAPKITNKNLQMIGDLSILDDIGWLKYVVGPIISQLGLYLCFFGETYKSINKAIIGFLAGFIAVYVLLNSFVTEDTNWARWTIFGIALLCGIALASIFFCIEKVTLFGSGVFLGIILSKLLYNQVLYRLDVMTGGTWFYWITTVVLSVGFGVQASYQENMIWIIATSAGGAYLSVKAAGKIKGDYPDEISLAKDIEDHVQDVTIPHWVYLGLTVVLIVAGVIIQCIAAARRRNNSFSNKENNQGEYHNIGSKPIRVEVQDYQYRGHQDNQNTR